MKSRTLLIIVLLLFVVNFCAHAGTFPSRTYTVKRGDKLWDLSNKFYGNNRYARVIALHNNIPDPPKLRAHLVLRVPDLKSLLEAEGLYEVASHEVDAILKARALFRKNEPLLLSSRRGKSAGKVAIPTEASEDLKKAAESIDSAIAGLKGKESVKATPKHMIGQLEGVSRNLKELADGSYDGYGYDTDMVEQRLVHAICNGIKWARAGFE